MICRKCNKEIPEDAVFCHICGTRQVAAERKHRKRPNGSGTIAKLSGGRAKPWMARKAGVLIGTYATRNEAQKALDKLADTYINNKYNMTFSQIYEQWLPEHSRMISKQAVANYRSAYNHSEPLHDRQFRSLRRSDFQSVIIEMEEKGLSKSSCEKAMQLFGQLSAWAISEEIMQVDHSRHCTIAAKQKTEGRVIPDDALQRIKESTNKAAPIVRILLSTGCRCIDLFTAKLENCYDGYFISGSKSEAGRDRIIAVSGYGAADYAQLVKDAKAANGDLLIAGYAGNKRYINFSKRDFVVLMDEIGLDGFTPYDCKHTFITNAVRKGIDKQTLRIMVGHADLNTTDKYYTHLEMEDIMKAIAALNE